MRRIVFLLLLFSMQARAQQTLTWARADSLTYAQYLAKDYRALERTANAALNDGIDFFYLRMRLGIAFYEQKNYEAALPHFKRAYAMSPADSTALEYLYYSYLFTGRTEEALTVAENGTFQFREKLGLHEKKLDAVAVSAGVSTTDNIAANEHNRFFEPGFAYSETQLNGATAYGQVLIQHTRRTRFHFSNAAMLIHTTSTDIIQHDTVRQSQSFTNMHFQYNFGLTYRYANGALLAGGLGYYKVTNSTLAPLLPPPGAPPRPNSFTEETTSYNGFLLSLTASRRFRYFEPSLSVNVSNLNGTAQQQGEATFTYYPFGNLRFYTVSKGALLHNDGQLQYVAAQSIGGRILPWWWYELHGSIGNHANYVTANGFVTYNSLDAVKLVAGGDFRFFAGKLEFDAGYRYQQREGSTSLVPQGNGEATTRTFNYTNNLFLTTLKWNF